MTRALAIVAPSYRDTSGGRVVLHELERVLRENGVPAYLVPWRATVGDFVTMPGQEAHVRGNPMSADVVLYPDIIRGNPYASERVVRWQLYHPRHPTRPGDRVVYYCEMFGPGPYLRLTTPRLDIFRNRGEDRVDAPCWVWRKAPRQGWADAERPTMPHELEKGLPLDALAAAYNRHKTFITYDNATFMAVQARLCGCDVVIRSKTPPDPDFLWMTQQPPGLLRELLIVQQQKEAAAAVKWAREVLA